LLIAEDRDRDDTTAKVSKEGEDRQRRRVHNTNSKQASFSDWTGEARPGSRGRGLDRRGARGR
jgi:hypothetical protein